MTNTLSTASSIRPDSQILAEDAKSNTDARTPPKPRLHYVDGLRALAAMIVILNHACQAVWWNVTPQGRMGRIYPWLFQGHNAVVAFIVLSGFCLMQPVMLSGELRGGAWKFYKGRALRILPAYWAALVVALLLIAAFIGQKHDIPFDIALPVTAQGVISHILLVNNFWGQPQMGIGGNPQINPVLWTVALEWQIYFWFPLLVWMRKRVGMLPILVIGFAVVGILHRLTIHHTWLGLNLQGLSLYFYFYFLLGMSAAVLAGSEKRFLLMDGRLFRPLAVCMIVGYALLYGLMLQGRLGERAVDLMELYTALMMVAILVSGARGGLKLLAWPPLVRIGTYSYSVYLLHLLLLTLLMDCVILPMRGHLSRNMEFGLLLILGFPLILMCSKVFAGIFEDKKQLTRCWEYLKNGRKI